MKKDKLAEQLTDILPNRLPSPGINVPKTSDLVNKEAERIQAKTNAKELARIKFNEKQKLARLQAKEKEKQALADKLGIDKIPEGQTLYQAEKLEEQRKRVEAIEAIEAETVNPLDPVEVAKLGGRGSHTSSVATALRLQGTTRPEIAKLLTSLNINLSIQLSKQDTANLLACLLTCNESQLNALLNNKKVPIVIKTVIKRLLEDLKIGNIETVEKLWDRVFGKNAMSLNLPEQAQLETGIIPNTPVSREAYVIIRDTLMK